MLAAHCILWVWSSFIGTFRGSEFERSAFQSRTTSRVVTTIVEKDRFFWSYYNRKVRNPFKLSVPSPTHPKAYSQSSITFTPSFMLPRNRAAWVTHRVFRQSSNCNQAGFSKNQCWLLNSCLRCSLILATTVVRTMSMWKHRRKDWPGEYLYSPERNQHQAWKNTWSSEALRTAWPAAVLLKLQWLSWTLF